MEDEPRGAELVRRARRGARGAGPAAPFPALERRHDLGGRDDHGQWLRERPQDYSLVVRSRIEPGLFVPAVSYLEALNARAHRDEFVAQVFGKVDVLHTPVMTMPAPTLAETTPGGSGEVMTMLAQAHAQHAADQLPGTALALGAGGFLPQSAAGRVPARSGDRSRKRCSSGPADAYQRETDWHTREPRL